MTPVLVDTGFVVSILDRSDRHHDHCRDVLELISDPFVTCEAVIAESCYLLRKLDGAVDAVLENVEKGVFRIPFLLTEHTPRVRNL
jgi:uncharacterized protein